MTPRQAFVLIRPFVLIRHGETDANRDGLIAGRIEAQLTDRGRAAARALSGRDWPPIAVFTSPQARARDTARLAFPGHAARKIEDLRERHWGRYEGRPIAELPERFSTPEGGESWADLMSRVAAGITAALDQAGTDLPVIVAHSGVIRACRALTGGAATGPSARNAQPLLFRPAPRGWVETPFFEQDGTWIA